MFPFLHSIFTKILEAELRYLEEIFGYFFKLLSLIFLKRCQVHSTLM